MASFTTQVCDRCRAHFPLEERPPSSRDWPVRKIKVDLHNLSLTEHELCEPCRKEIQTIFRQFMSGDK